ncbi:metalloprotease [Lithospermum erythrorhizon]|uniref:glutamate carboxypeptidase II n=1 Tax=Lithospermum erythrorhizon TaxID=34254 RepID=A0AAV3R115_LITER
MPLTSSFPPITKMPLTQKHPCTLLSIFTLFILASYTFIHHPHPPNSTTTLFLSSANNATIAAYLRRLTLHPHLAGTPQAFQTALYVKNHFQTLQLSTHMTNYTTLLSYPIHSSLSGVYRNGTFALFNEYIKNDVVLPYHAYSPSGRVYSKAVFLNYGRKEDYKKLSVLGVEVKGCIGLVRRGGGMSRNAVVEMAADNGVAAVLMYTEGNIGVERGTVMKGVGDPLSPGWGAVEGGEKLELDDEQVLERFTKVPSMPVSVEVAQTILRSLGGCVVPFEWRESLRSFGVGFVGPGPTVLNFTYEGEMKVATIHNVFAVIPGSEEPDRYVLLGNHRDAWTYGAVDPNSGTAALLDIARRYALLKRSGWNPRRTIVLCSWDAEEFGMIGSSEWVEQNLVNLDSKAVAYLNVDCAAQGPGFFVGATPQLDDLVRQITKKVKDPDSESTRAYENWKSAKKDGKIQRLSGVDSDFAPFLQHAGVPSVDMYYGGEFPVYHTAFDSYDWMIRVGDPLFHRHVAVTGVWGLLALRLADDPILPFNYSTYAEELQVYASTMSNLLGNEISLRSIFVAIEDLICAAKQMQEEIKELERHETSDGVSLLKRRMLNDRLMLTERGFLDPMGLQGRKWFKHLIYGPHNNIETRLDFFPGLVDAISRAAKLDSRERKAVIEHEVWRIARAIQRASSALRGGLS